MTALAAASRQVQRLHLRAPDQTLSRRGARLLEDALRTATLPDSGARMLVFRRLALGRFGSEISPQTLSLALERRVAALRSLAVHAPAPSAVHSVAVWFRDALEAHTLLAQRIADGAPAHEWFWPLVVAGIERQAAPPQRLRLVLRSLSRAPEAPTALPLLARALAQRGHLRLVEAAIGATETTALLAAARAIAPSASGATSIPPIASDAPPAAVHGRVPVARHTDHRAQVSAPSVRPPEDARPKADAAEPSSSAPPARKPSSRRPAMNAATRPDATAGALSPLAARRAPPRATLGAMAGALPPLAVTERHADDVASIAALQQRQPTNATTGEAAERGNRHGHSAAAQNPAEAGRDPLDQPAWPCAAPTQAGGLLFLLPVLARLGYAQWLDQAPEWAPLRIDRRVLALVCSRLALPTDDPAWWLCATSASAAPERYRALSLWIAGIADCDSAWRRCATADGTRLWDASGRLLLAAWQGRRRPAAFAPLVRDRRIVRSDDNPRGADLTSAVTEAWLTACRRWLRRRARLGVASLVARPARLSLTPTHADVFFALSGINLAVRRAGLDLDPGWVPWFGRVVTFHYGRTPWT
jgi:hypothetical protein